MSRIVPKLNLNKTPQLVENNSLVMAKNIRLLEDGTIGPDTSLQDIRTEIGDINTEIVHHDAVTDDVTFHEYTILDCDTTINYVKEVTSPDEEHLDDVAFDFRQYYPISGETSAIKIVKVDSSNRLVTYVYKLNGQNIVKQKVSLEYDINRNVLYNQDNVLALCVQYSYYDTGVEVVGSVLPTYFYCLIPKVAVNNQITLHEVDYIFINPVYQTTYTNTVIIVPAYDEEIQTLLGCHYIGQIVGLDNKIYFFKESLYIKYSLQVRKPIEDAYPGEIFPPDNGYEPKEGDVVTFGINADGYVTRNGLLFEDLTIATTLVPNINDRIKIFEYDEVFNTFKLVPCNWNYSGGKINGCVFKNNTGKSILTVCEYDLPNDVFVPIKHIDLSSCRVDDDESIYTQNPNIPITNLNIVGEHVATIPAGVYQFFIRYKINENRYTSWFPCTKELFAGTKKTIATIQGELKYIDRHVDADTSFVFQVEHLFSNFDKIYSKFQIGFILSKDDESIIAREWKEFDFNTTDIYFDFVSTDIQEADIDEMLETTYEIFNVKNCVNYKNRLYIANYNETDFNPNLDELAKSVQIRIKTKEIGSAISSTYFDGELLISSSNNNNFDYVGNESNHIRNKWGVYKYFKNSNYNQEESDERNYFQSVPLVSSTYKHIENSNVEKGDQTYGHTIIGEGDDAGTTGGWMNCPIDFGYNKAYILAIYIKDGNNWIDILGVNYSDTYDNPGQYDPRDPYSQLHYISIAVNNPISIVNKVNNILRDYIVYYSTTNNKWYIKDSSNNVHEFTDYYIVYSVVKRKNILTITQDYYSTPYGPNLYFYKSNGEIFSPTFSIVTTQKTTYILKRNTVFDTSFVSSTIEGDKKEYPTLLPFTKYNFYIHYVKNNGVITNGYLINSSPVYLDEYCIDDGGYNTQGNVNYYIKGDPITTYNEDNIIIYPAFENIVKPDNYIACFISIAKVGNNVCQLFNVRIPESSIGNKYYYKADCLELDTLLYPKYDKIRVITSSGDIVTNEAKYYDSGNTENINYFGECGSVVFDTDAKIETNTGVYDNLLWIVIETNESTKRIIKFTPFIKLESSAVSYDNYNDINNIGFTCSVKKLIKNDINNDIYVSDNDVYILTKGENNSIIDTSLKLSDNENHYMLRKSNPEYRIKSNFNLNYLNLSEDINAKVKTVSLQNEASKTILLYAVNSLISSYIYQYNKWYNEYTRKLYSEIEDNKEVRFDNTIRSSRVIGDEEYNTFKFDSIDYYNVPTLRGIITNLISIANSIYVHCEHSLFRFSGNKTLNAQEEEVTLQENDVFNSGITEVFDAQYGYAGLKNREQSLITYNSYVFYDAFAKTIYAFGGEQQIASITEPIKKILNVINPTDVRFVGDELHNRFFVNLINDEGNVCLSFNFNAKSFISVHDFNFKFGFHSRSNTYFIHDNLFNDTIIGWSIYKIVDSVITLEPINPGPVSPITPGGDERAIVNANKVTNYTAYQNCYTQSLIKVEDCDTYDILNEVNSLNSCVDILVNVEYEKIKVVNFINWICSEIINYGITLNYAAEERLNRKYPGTKLRIYTDSTSTRLIELLDSNGNPLISNNERNINEYGDINANPNSWKYPQYNCGIWSMNYFRDILNIVDIFDYKDSDNKITGGVGHSETTNLTPKVNRQNLTQENSLIYGKYVVVRFIFNNKNFKLENVIVRMNDYEKTK